MVTGDTLPLKAITLKNFLERNMQPEVVEKNYPPAGAYVVVVKFIMDKNGNSSGIVATTSNGFGMELEVVRVIKRMSNWTPGPFPKEYCKLVMTYIVSDK